MAWRLAIDRWRAERRRERRESHASVDVAAPTVEDDAVAAERSALLWRAVDTLPEKLRAVIILSAMLGHDVRQVAQLLEIPEGTVKSRLFLARAALASSHPPVDRRIELRGN